MVEVWQDTVEGFAEKLFTSASIRPTLLAAGGRHEHDDAFIHLGVSGAAVARFERRLAGATSLYELFVTSSGIGKGADLGGLEGADRHCQQLAQAAGAGNRTWHAYLSAQAVDGQPAVNARDRIGHGPWQNAKGVVIAKDVDELHSNNHLTKQTALTERGDVVNGRGDSPNKHDPLTATQAGWHSVPARGG